MIRKNERRWVLYFALVVMLFTCLPYLFAWSRQGTGWVFTGFLVGAEDGNSYIANMQSGSAGYWLWRSPYSTYPQTGTIVFETYLLLGKLAPPPASHSLLVLLYHLFRFIAGVLAILATHDFLALFIQRVRFRRICTALVALGGGLGWIILLFGKSTLMGSIPVEFISPEAFGFLAIFSIPHLALARAFLLWGLRSYLLATQENGRKFWWGSAKTGVFWLLTGLAQPLTGMVVGAIPALHLVTITIWGWIRPTKSSNTRAGKMGSLPSSIKPYFQRFMVAGAIAAPFVLYNAIVFSIDPFLKLWNQQSAIPSPSPLLYVLAYSLALPFAIAGGWLLFRRNAGQGLFLIPWIVVFLVVIYLPFSLQRRLLEGIWVAWVALTGIALEYAASKVSVQSPHSGRIDIQLNPEITTNAIPQVQITPLIARWIRKLSPVLSLSFLATLILMAGSFASVITPQSPLFQPVDEVAAFTYLAENANPGDVVLSAYQTGNVLPAWTPLHVVIGIETLTANIFPLETDVKLFFQPETSMSQRQAFLASQHVAYVFWGKNEKELGNWDPNQAPFLEQVFEQGDYQVFKVITSMAAIH